MAFTWNPSDKSADLVLSGGNLTAAHGAVTGGVSESVRGTGSLTAGGKFYWSGVVTVGPGTNSLTFAAILNASAALNSFPGADLNGTGYLSGGQVIINGTTVATLPTYTTGDVVDTAIDLTHLAIWFRKNGGNWNNSGAASPTSNVGGISISSLNAGPYYPAFWANNPSCAATANFGATAFSNAAPSGFLPLDAITLSATGLATGSPVLPTPTLHQVHALTTAGIATSSPAIGAPALAQVLATLGLTCSAPVLGTPALTAARVLALPVSGKIVTAYPVAN